MNRQQQCAVLTELAISQTAPNNGIEVVEEVLHVIDGSGFAVTVVEVLTQVQN